MPIEDFHQKIPLDQVIVKREERQRRKIDDIESFAMGIYARGLLHPIVINRDNTLFAGERRLTAFKFLNEKFAAEERWGSIPFRYFDALDATEAAVVELEENLSRSQLSWQETALAVKRVHDLFLASDPDQTSVKTAEHIGMEISLFRKNQLVAEALAQGDELVASAISVHEAYNKVKRGVDRAAGEEVNKLLSGMLGSLTGASPTVNTQTGTAQPATAPAAPSPAISPTPAPSGRDAPPTHHPGAVPTPAAPPPPVVLPAFLNVNFLEWASTYSGEPFNFIHCDFPYGIDHQKSAQGRVDEYGAYADQEDVYWKLLEGMAKHKKRLIYPSAHMIFWFSMKFHGQTIAFFQKHFPEFTIEECPLIWWKDRSIAPDVQRRPRRAYETALFMFSGNRPIVNTRSNLVQAPCGNKIHSSEKPARMLRAFFQMVVDKHTRMLDPTCGSGTSVRAAKSLGANVAVGIEKHTPFYDSAVRAYQIAQALNFKDIQEVEDAVE